VQRATQLVIADTPDGRVAADLTRQLAGLIGIHGASLPVVDQLGALYELTLILEHIPHGDDYLLDLDAVRHRSPLGPTSVADLIIQFHGRPSQELRGRMENAPSDLMSINPDRPHSWLSTDTNR
jgi:hypothetical protein